MPDILGLCGHGAHGTSTVALQPVHAQRDQSAHAEVPRAAAPVLDLGKLDWIEYQRPVAESYDAVAEAMVAYCALGIEQPNYRCLSNLRKQVNKVAAEMLELAPFAGEPADFRTIEHAFESAKQDLEEIRQIDGGGLKAALRQINLICRGMDMNDRAALMRALPALRAALNDYHRQIEDCFVPGSRFSESAVHERNRAELDQPARAALLQRLAQRTHAAWHSDANVYQLLGIKPDYQASEADAAAFEQVFKQGRLIRTGGKYASATECLDLFDLYAKHMRAAQRDGDVPPDIPLAELIALRTYSVSSNELNQALREGDSKTVREFAPMIKLLVSALNRLPDCGSNTRQSKKILFRGIKLTANQLIESGYVKGNKLVIPSFASCATSGSTQYTQHEHFNVQLEIEQRDAKLIDNTSLYKGREDEALFKPMSCFEVLSVRYDENSPDPNYPYVTIKLRQIDADDLFTPARSSAAQLVHAGYFPQSAIDTLRQSE